MFAFCVAILNSVLAFSKVYFESQALQESGFEYIVENMQARQGWIPFIHLIKEQRLKHDIMYFEIYAHYPFLTDTLGLYYSINYEFTDATLITLLNHVKFWLKAGQKGDLSIQQPFSMCMRLGQKKVTQEE